VLAWSLVAQGKLAEALKVVDTAKKLLAKSDNREKRLPAFIIAARVRAASGETVQTAKSLEPILAEATKFHLVAIQFEARLALAEIEMKSGKTAAGRARLVALEKDATANGFLLVARKAHALGN